MSRNTENASKKARLLGEDRLSKLHESVISHLLSRLTPKDAVRTSILSKDWEHKWTCSYSIDMECQFLQRDNQQTLMNIVQRLLLSPKHLRCFRFAFRSLSDWSCVQTWIDVVALRHDHLECLQAQIPVRDLIFPDSLLNSTSLRTLTLVQQHECTLHVRKKNCALNLTSLMLAGLEIVNMNRKSSTMTFDFPVLKTLELRACIWLYVESVEIYAPLLTTFKTGTENMYTDYDYTMNIVAPRLTKFTCNTWLPEKIILDGSSIVSAFLHCIGHPCHSLLKAIGLRARNLLNQATSLEELELSSLMAKASQLGPPLSRHDKMTHLGLFDQSNPKQLLELLHAMPSLKILRLNMDKWKKYDYEAMEVVPSCIVSHLEVVVVYFFDHRAPNYDLVKFLFKNAKRLKKFIIGGETTDEYEKQHKVLSGLSTCSPSVSIQVAMVARLWEYKLAQDPW